MYSTNKIIWGIVSIWIKYIIQTFWYLEKDCAPENTVQSLEVHHFAAEVSKANSLF